MEGQEMTPTLQNGSVVRLVDRAGGTALRRVRQETNTRASQEAETLDDGEPSDDEIVLEALITEPDPLWWDFGLMPWDWLYPAIPF
jgi:hypothetical protein